MKICVAGLWHLGCVTAACLAELGLTVIGLDEGETIKSLTNGYTPLYEPGLNELIQKHIDSNLHFTDNIEEAVSDADFTWITYDTPVDDNDNADVSFVINSVKTLFPYFRKDVGIIISSQLPVRSTRMLQQVYLEGCYFPKVVFAYSPENLRLGGAVNIFLHPDRIVVGSDESDKSVFAPLFEKISSNIEWMGIESAEMTKHAINAFLATSATFANEIASLCEYVGADARQVARGLKTEKRIGPKAYVAPSSAIAGGTLNRDMRFLSQLSQEFSFPAALIHGAINSNERHKLWAVRKLKLELGDLDGKKVSVLGLAYKPGTDTLRRSLSIELCKMLVDAGVQVRAFDPLIKNLDKPYADFIRLVGHINEVFPGADALVVSTECQEFKGCLKPELIKAMHNKLLVDANAFLAADVKDCAEQMKYIVFGGSR